MRIGDLVRFHGGLLSTAPIALVVDWSPCDRFSNYEKLKVLWQSGTQYGKGGWMPAHTLEKVIER